MRYPKCSLPINFLFNIMPKNLTLTFEIIASFTEISSVKRGPFLRLEKKIVLDLCGARSRPRERRWRVESLIPGRNK